MATEVLELIIRTTGARAAATELDTVTKSSNALTGALRFMRNALVAMAFARAALGVVSLLDAFITLQNKIALVTRDTQEANIAMEALSQVAIRSRTPLEATVTMFTRMSRALVSMNLTYGELLDVTESVNKALIISGATSDEARNAIIQFTQGLSLGVLRGQDLRSVVEFAPRMAQIFADQLGKMGGDAKLMGEAFRLSGGQLYAFTQQHRNILTSKIAIESLLHVLKDLNVEFDKTKPTIGQAWTNLTTAVEIFVGRAATASGIIGGIITALDYVRGHLNAFAEGLALVAGLFVFNILAGQILSFGLVAFRVISGVTGLLGVMARVTLLTASTGSILIRGFLGLGLIAAIIYGIVLLFQAWGVTTQDLVDYFERFAASVITIMEELGRLLNAFWDSFREGGITAFNFISAQFTEFLNHFRSESQKPWQMEYGTSAGGGDRLNAFFNGKEQANAAGKYEENLKTVQGLVGGIQGYFDKMGKGGITTEMIEMWRKLKAMLSGTADEMKNFNEKTEAARASLLQFLHQIAPYAAAMAKRAELQVHITKALKEEVDVGEVFKEIHIDQTEAEKRFARETLGVGNALAYYLDKIQLVDEALINDTITTAEATERHRELRVELLGFNRDVASGVALSVLKFQDVMAHQEKIAEDIINTAAAGGHTFDVLKVQIVALDLALQKHVITAKEYRDTLRDVQITALDTQTDAQSGFARGMLKVQKELADTAKLAEQVVTDMFSGMTDALVGFFKTGKLSLKSLVDSIQTDLLKLAVTKNITAPIAGLLGFTDGQKGGGSPLTNLLGGLFGDKGSLTGGKLGTKGTPMIVAFDNSPATSEILDSFNNGGTAAATKIGDAFQQQNGGGGFLSRLSSLLSGGGGGGGSQWLSSLINIGASAFGSGAIVGGATLNSDGMTWTPGAQGFAAGGSFIVGGNGGTDSQNIKMRMTPGERVTVETPAQQANSALGGDGRKTMLGELHLHLYGVTDHDSFQRAEGQIYSRAAARLQRAAMRDG